ncbi:hypothetical protein AVEN_179508-1 [Araneus ventricosus]|uniref:Uncharacterized protein n=1 Tax=Araneus ventricosus TaxID=182803 RepID=A0A4Y2IWL0_ARAVE|nr:hypothetical protein AVEN_179508-1 [Araneus ventricosus]
MILNAGIQKYLKTKTQSADSNLRHRCEDNGKTKDLPILVLRDEGRNEIPIPSMGGEELGVEFCHFEPCLKTKFGASMNALSIFSSKMGEKTQS